MAFFVPLILILVVPYVTVYAIAAMPGTNLVLEEVKLEGGTVGCSSVYDTTTKWAPSNAILLASDKVWQSGRDATGNGDLGVPFPHLIWYDFKKAFIPRRVSFRAAYPGCNQPGFCGATKYQFIGTNDEVCNRYSKWTVLCEDMSGALFERKTQSKYCTIDPWVYREPFRCLGVSVLDSAYPGYVTVTMAGLRMWK